MALIKAPFDGIGSGSGVAWPLFGLIFSSFGLAIGGVLAAIIGAISSVIFIAICLPIFYLSYRESLQETQVLSDKLNRHYANLINDLDDYVEILYEKYQIDSHHNGSPENLRAYVQQHMTNLPKLSVDDIPASRFRSLLQALCATDNHAFWQALNQHDKRLKRRVLVNMTYQQLATITRNKPPIALILASALMGFVGAFGAIAGGGSGFMGLLSGLGLFAGVSAVPVVGWVVLATAIVVGVILAAIVVQKAVEKFQIKQETNLLKELDKVVSATNTEQMMSLKAYKIAVNLGVRPRCAEKLVANVDIVNDPNFKTVVDKKHDHPINEVIDNLISHSSNDEELHFLLDEQRSPAFANHRR